MDSAVNVRQEAIVELEKLNEMGWLVQDVHRHLNKIFDAHAKSIGLTRSQCRVLIQLSQDDGRTQTELADIVKIEKAPLGRMLDKLEKAGWVHRELDLNDRRVRRVYTTSRIEPYLSTMIDMTRQTVVNAFDALDELEAAQLKTALDKVKNRLKDQAS